MNATYEYIRKNTILVEMYDHGTIVRAFIAADYESAYSDASAYAVWRGSRLNQFRPA